MVALDQKLGIQGKYSKRANRLLTFAATNWPFAKGADYLEEFCGLQVSDETLRQHSYTEAEQVKSWQEESPKAVEHFADAPGDVEFQTDANKVNTIEGWRDMKIGLFLKRPRGTSATAQEWADRRLPAPTARYAFAAIAPSEEFGQRWKPTARRLGIDSSNEVSVLADGAEWIWKEAAQAFPFSEGVLDIFHAAEHLAEAAKATWGESSETGQEWVETGRMALLKDGWYGLCEHLGRTWSGSEAPANREPLEALINYFAKQQTHLNYALRLHQGQSIGSGAVEGAGKNMIAQRMKRSGARWRVDNANRMAVLCSTVYSGIWESYWDRN